MNDITNIKLFALLAKNPDDQKLWREFTIRFHERIRLNVIKVLGIYQPKRVINSMDTVDDIAQDVYLRLYQNNGRALRNFKGDTDESLYCYLNVIAMNITLNSLRAERAQKRPPAEVSLDAKIDAGYESAFTGPSQKGQIHEQTDEAIQIMELREHLGYYLDVILKGKNKTKYKMLFMLNHFEGVAPEDLAKIPNIGMNAHAIEVAVSRVRHRLMKYMDYLEL